MLTDKSGKNNFDWNKKFFTRKNRFLKNDRHYGLKHPKKNNLPNPIILHDIPTEKITG